MENGSMTNEIKNLLEKIENNKIFERYPLYFIGGTALSTYLDHRISYDIDFACTRKLPISDIKAFAFSINGKEMMDRAKASAFRINKGEDLAHYHLKFMVNDIKMEFSYFDDSMIDAILEHATLEAYNEESKLKKLSLNDIIQLKAIALFKRQKSRDLFDMAMILEHRLISIEELERIYSFKQYEDKTLLEYINSFDPRKDDEGDTSLDFLPKHEHHKTFAKLKQDERFDKCKEMFLVQYDNKQKEKLQKKQKEVVSNLKRSKGNYFQGGLNKSNSSKS